MLCFLFASGLRGLQVWVILVNSYSFRLRQGKEYEGRKKAKSVLLLIIQILKSPKIFEIFTRYQNISLSLILKFPFFESFFISICSIFLEIPFKILLMKNNVKTSY